jgi:hypothetical protein
VETVTAVQQDKCRCKLSICYLGNGWQHHTIGKAEHSILSAPELCSQLVGLKRERGGGGGCVCAHAEIAKFSSYWETSRQ